MINDKNGRKKCLVTGVAGFVGSHIARRLVSEGCPVVGIDLFTDYYDRQLKEKNIADLLKSNLFTLIRQDIVTLKPDELDGVQWVFHQAAQAGVRASWGEHFSQYAHHNILGTQHLLELFRHLPVEKFIYASSSSVYGDSKKLPMHEDDLPRPMSPYGVTKLAAEHLCNLYHQNYSLPAVSLRYFTVYGPSQRPDMAFHRFMCAAAEGNELVIYGSGEQTRDFTYIEDIVEANLAAAHARNVEGRVYNIGGGSRISINGVLKIIESVSKKPLRIRYEPIQAGDPPHTYADTERAKRDLNYNPKTSLEEGLVSMYRSIVSG